MAKTVLKYGDEEFDFLLIGIATTYRDFRVCREINQALSIEMVRVDDYLIYDPKREEDIPFPFFEFCNEQEDRYHLIGNKSDRGLLVSEQKNLDFFLLVKPGQSELDVTEIAQRIKPLRMFQGVFVLDPIKLKSKEYLLF
ncbi:MAG: IPExxxVDY family protein [Bacteroidota bacterium]